MALVLLAACATAPKTTTKRDALKVEADHTLAVAESRHLDLKRSVDQAAGYAVFPEIGAGGAVVGGARGRGVLYQKGKAVGYVSLTQASVGALIGGRTYSELVVFRTPEALARVKRGQYTLGADASVVVLQPGAAASTDVREDVVVFVMPRGGLMADVSVSGQRLEYQPMAS